MVHLDLFAGIGGFSLALDEVFYERPIKHIFCEIDPFCQAVLKQHWPDGQFWGDIADLVAHTGGAGLEETQTSQPSEGSGRNSQPATDATGSGLQGDVHRPSQAGSSSGEAPHTWGGHERDAAWSIVTGGFPCQPFSHAGRRRGTADDRYQWPNMYAVIRNTKPDWVIAENVRGLVTWNEGMVLEQVCSDLEAEGYEVQAFVVPALAVNAPHRRDRVWIIGYTQHNGQYGTKDGKGNNQRSDSNPTRTNKLQQSRGSDSSWQATTDTRCEHGQSRFNHESESNKTKRTPETEKTQRFSPTEWNKNWPEVATRLCSVDDGLSRIVDGVPYSRAKWRKESLKAYGSAIVPQVAMQIFNAIKESS